MRAGGPGRRTGGDTGTAPWADLTTAVHAQQGESGPSKRAFTLGELEAFFGYAGGQVEAIRLAGRKGWWPAFRDATLFKVAYGFGAFSGGANKDTRCVFLVSPGRRLINTG